jgi:hypothetical protein
MKSIIRMNDHSNEVKQLLIPQASAQVRLHLDLPPWLRQVVRQYKLQDGGDPLLQFAFL